MDPILADPARAGRRGGSQRTGRDPAVRAANVRDDGLRRDRRVVRVVGRRARPAAGRAPGPACARGDTRALDSLAAPGHRSRHRIVRCRLDAEARSARIGDDAGGDRHRAADSHLFGLVHAGRAAWRPRAVLLLHEPVLRVHAAARPGGKLPGVVRRLGGRGPLLVPADRILVREAVGGDGRVQGLPRQPHRRLGLPGRCPAGVYDVWHAGLPGGRGSGHAAAGRSGPAVPSRSSACCCSSA